MSMLWSNWISPMDLAGPGLFALFFLIQFKRLPWLSGVLWIMSLVAFTVGPPLLGGEDLQVSLATVLLWMGATFGVERLLSRQLFFARHAVGYQTERHIRREKHGLRFLSIEAVDHTGRVAWRLDPQTKRAEGLEVDVQLWRQDRIEIPSMKWRKSYHGELRVEAQKLPERALDSVEQELRAHTAGAATSLKGGTRSGITLPFARLLESVEPTEGGGYQRQLPKIEAEQTQDGGLDDESFAFILGVMAHHLGQPALCEWLAAATDLQGVPRSTKQRERLLHVLYRDFYESPQVAQSASWAAQSADPQLQEAAHFLRCSLQELEQIVRAQAPDAAYFGIALLRFLTHLKARGESHALVNFIAESPHVAGYAQIFCDALLYEEPGLPTEVLWALFVRVLGLPKEALRVFRALNQRDDFERARSELLGCAVPQAQEAAAQALRARGGDAAVADEALVGLERGEALGEAQRIALLVWVGRCGLHGHLQVLSEARAKILPEWGSEALRDAWAQAQEEIRRRISGGTQGALSAASDAMEIGGLSMVSAGQSGALSEAALGPARLSVLHDEQAHRGTERAAQRPVAQQEPPA